MATFLIVECKWINNDNANYRCFALTKTKVQTESGCLVSVCVHR